MYAPLSEDNSKKCPISRQGDFGAYRLRAGELGRYVEIDEVVSHENVGHAIAIVSHLRNEAGGNATSMGTGSLLARSTRFPAIGQTSVGAAPSRAGHFLSPGPAALCSREPDHLPARSLLRWTRTPDSCPNGTAPPAAEGSGWLTVSKARIRPVVLNEETLQGHFSWSYPLLSPRSPSGRHTEMACLVLDCFAAVHRR